MKPALIKTNMSCPDCGKLTVYSDMSLIAPTFSCECGFCLSVDFVPNRENKKATDGEV